MICRLVILSLLWAAANAQTLEKEAQSMLRGKERDLDSSENKIVGGTSAALGEFKFFVQGNGCGASLVAPDVVLTAAHCDGAFPFQSGNVYVAPLYLSSSAEGEEARQVVGNMLKHPNYNGNTMQNDFMLFKITPSTKPPIALNFARELTSGEDLTVIGFGTTSSGGSQSENLLKVTVDFVPHSTCNGSTMYNGQIYSDSMICAARSGKDSCQGDSGGPIFDTSGVLVGVVSWGDGCALANKPGVYSKVYGARDWLKTNICALSDYKSSLSFCPGSAPVPAPPTGPAPTAPVPSPTAPAPVPTAPAPSPVSQPVAGPPSPNCGSPVPAPTPVQPAPTGPAPTAPAPTQSCSSTPKYEFEMRYDNYPEETRWFLKDTLAGTSLYNWKAGKVTEPGKTIYIDMSAKLTQGRKYTLSFRDSYQGFCCADAPSSGPLPFARLTKTVNCVATVLAEEDGKFSTSANINFTA